MAFIKFSLRSIRTRASLNTASAIFIAILLSACGAMPKKDTSSQNTVTEAPKDETPLVVIANPYLQHSSSVPAAAQTEFVHAQVAMQSEDWSTAEKTLKGLTQSHPKLSGPYVNLGIVYWRQNKMDEAELSFIKATEVNPLNNDAYNQLGILLREQGRFADAETWYLKGLSQWPHAPETLRNLGILYDLYMGKFNEALSQYELALKVTPNPSRELEGWIIDLKRRLAEGGTS